VILLTGISKNNTGDIQMLLYCFCHIKLLILQSIVGMSFSAADHHQSGDSQDSQHDHTKLTLNQICASGRHIKLSLIIYWA